MSVVFVGNTTSDFNVTRSNDVSDVNPTASQADTSFVDLAIRVVSDQSVVVSAFEYTYNQTTGINWLHFDMRTAGFQGDSRLDGHIVSFFDSSNNLVARLDVLDGRHRAQVNGNTIVYGSSVLLGSLTLYVVDISLEVTPSTIQMNWYLNGSLQHSISVSNTVVLRTNPTRTVFDVTGVGFGTSFDGFIYISQVIQTDENDSTIEKKLFKLPIVSVGDYTDWSISISEISDNNKATAITTSSINQFQSWNLGVPNIPSLYIIDKLVSNYLGSVSGPDVGNFVTLFRYSGVNYENPPVTFNNLSATPVVSTQNPLTLSSWDPLDFSNFQQGIKTTI